MQLSTEHILTTHAGSLAAPQGRRPKGHRQPYPQVASEVHLLEAANPRHEHEWAVWKDVKLPDDKALIVGVIDTKTNSVEHPELVAERLEQFANIVGKELVIAATDCGFATFVGFRPCHPEAAWLKLRALVEGAQLASQRLW